jgi:formiminotetrahydrofolate cyclodeaminase
MFAEDRIKDFLESVAAKRPTPGGGSVSAVVGALGAALGVMTARYSEDADAEAALDALKNEFAALADADAEAYGLVTSAQSLPKDNEETKRRRKTALQAALADASEVPLKGMGMAAKGLEVLAGLSARCNKHLISDLAAACGFVWAALEGCAENVRINAGALTDAERRGRLEAERARLLAAGAESRMRIAKAVEAVYASK